MKPNDLPVINKTVEHLLRMRQALLDRPEDRFDMLHWQRPSSCGTVCCLLGTYIEAYGEETGLKFFKHRGDPLAYPASKDRKINKEELHVLNDSIDDISKTLGLTWRDCHELFVPSYYRSHQGQVTKAMVLNRLDIMIEKYSKGDIHET